ncbi:MAG: hypothetical protein ACRD1T_24170, partial [Acidimicrobiia bacterium]
MAEQRVDTTNWSGEGEFTQTVLDRLKSIETISFIRVEDAPSTRSEANYSFISNEIYVGFVSRSRTEPTIRFGVWRSLRTVEEKMMSLSLLERELTSSETIG